MIVAAVSGFLPGETAADDLPLSSTWLPGAIATVLAIMIVAYDGPLKKTPLAPYAMGSCRFLSFLLGASPALVIHDGPLIPKFLIAIALGFGVYIAGITTIARDEAVGGHSPHLNTGMLLVIIGTLILAFAPQTAPWQLWLAILTSRHLSHSDRFDCISGDHARSKAVSCSISGEHSKYDPGRRANDYPVGGVIRFVGSRPILGGGHFRIGRSGPLGIIQNASDMMLAGFHASSLLLHDEAEVVRELATLGFQCVAIRPRCGSLDPDDERFSGSNDSASRSGRASSYDLGG